MSKDNLLIETDGAVRRVTVNRPAALNALDGDTLRELMGAVREIRRAREIRAAVLAGAGDRAFVAGADVAAMVELTAIEARHFSKLGHRLMRALEELPVPVIAAVRGFALGGGLELALACDFIIAGEGSRFGQPEINLGIIPGFGGTQRLARRIGIARARELIYSGAIIDAREAYRLGLVNRIVPDAEVLEEAVKTAAGLAAKPAVAMGQAKAVLNGTEGMLAVGTQCEAEAFGVAFASPDRVEGMRAFLEKRQPKFQGR